MENRSNMNHSLVNKLLDNIVYVKNQNTSSIPFLYDFQSQNKLQKHGLSASGKASRPMRHGKSRILRAKIRIACTLKKF